MFKSNVNVLTDLKIQIHKLHMISFQKYNHQP